MIRSTGLIASSTCIMLSAASVAAPAPAGIPCWYEAEMIIGDECGPGYPLAYGLAFNSDLIVGKIAQCPLQPFRAWRGDITRGLTLLPLIPGYDGSVALDVNDRQQIVGSVDESHTGLSLAVMWDDDGVTPLGFPAAGNYSTAAAINNDGVIVGYWGNTATTSPQAAIWHDGTFVDLGAMLGTAMSRADDINEAGVIVGTARPDQDDEETGFIITGGESVLIGPIEGGISSKLVAVNEHGDVGGCGLVITEGGGEGLRAFVRRNGMETVYGIVPGRTHSCVLDLNDDGLWVGMSWGSVTGIIGRDGVMLDLNDLVITPGLVVLRAEAVDDDGRIVGLAQFGGRLVAVLLTPHWAIAGDLDCDDVVGPTDLKAIIDAWNSPGAADLDGNGIVGPGDLAILLANWSQ